MGKEAEGLKIKLKRLIECRADGKTYSESDKLASKTYPGIAANTQEERKLELHLDEIAQQSRRTLNKKRKKKGEYSEEDCALAELMQPTLNTKLIRCEYILEVVLDFTGCCAADPTMRLPLIIFAPSINRPPPQGIMPANWAPQELGQLQFQIPVVPESQFYQQQMQQMGFPQAPQMQVQMQPVMQPVMQMNVQPGI